MSARIANCPNCGGQVEFKAGTSLLSVCPYCSSAVARKGDDIGELEILGKVAPLADLGSPLGLGMSGRDGRGTFTLIGRAQLDWGQGPWNEWYAAFDDGSWGWLAEAQGKVYLTKPITPPGELPRFHQARVGARIPIGNTQVSITERRRAKLVAIEGELPFRGNLGDTYAFCDFEGPSRTFGTFDYGDGEVEPEVFFGREHAYVDLFDASILKERGPGKASGEALNCPSCAAPVELRSPDTASRVTCSSCDSLLDVGPGGRFEIIAKVKGPEPLLPLGAKARFDRRDYVLYAQLVRSVTAFGVRYPWEEYLLRDVASGAWRWLVQNDGHWSFVEPISAGEVEWSDASARYDGERFRQFQSGTARVDALKGELYWKVAVGETVGTSDYVAPPRMLSLEKSHEEVTWSVGRYVPKAEVEAAFKLERSLRSPSGIAPNQPNPWGGLGTVFAAAGVVSLLLIALGAIFRLTADNEVAFTATAPLSAPGTQAAQAKGTGLTWVSEPFELTKSGTLELSAEVAIPAGWVFLDGALVATDRSGSYPFGVLVNAVGDPPARRKVLLGGVLPGSYALRLTPEWSGILPPQMQIEVRRDVFVAGQIPWFIAMAWALPILMVFFHYAFEKARWSTSDEG